MKKTKVLFLDMDDVIVNLSQYVIEESNKYFEMDFDYRDNKTYYWGDTGISKLHFQALLNEKGTFLNPKPIDGAIEVIEKLFKEGYEIYILTTPQSFSKYCYLEKLKWIRKYLPFISFKNVIFTHNKGLLANENAILYDDSDYNLREFDKKGGIAIARPMGYTKFNKRVAATWDCFYDMVHKLEGVHV